MVGGLVDLNPDAPGFGINDDITTSADNFGGRSRTWNGVDLSVNARLDTLLLQGGISTGKTQNDTCALSAQLPEIAPTTANDFCDNATPFLTQVQPSRAGL